MRFEERESEGITILDLEGSITLAFGVPELRARLLALDRAGRVNVVLNLNKVGLIDLDGVDALLFARSELRARDGNLLLVHLNKAHLDLVALTKLAIEFELYEDEQDAVNAFFPGRTAQSFDVLEFVQQIESGEEPAPPEDPSSTASSGLPIASVKLPCSRATLQNLPAKLAFNM